MTYRIYGVAAILVAAILATVSATLAAGQVDDEARRLAGAWDITVQTPRGDAYSWLEVEPSGATLVGRFVGQVGSARPISRIELDRGAIGVSVPRQYEGRDLRFEGRLEADRLVGTVTGYAAEPCPWTAVRAPKLERGHPPHWGRPLALFNGRSLDGWKQQGAQSHWLVENGQLVNGRDGANLYTKAKFEDFKLHAQFRYPKGSNSGIYLRGRYEVQIEDDEGPELGVHSMGAVYGFFPPCVRAAKGPGEWQSLDITLVGRVVTVVLNGERIVDRQTIPGITGGALDSGEGAPGPILLQGDHGRIEFRKIVLTPADAGP